MQAGVFKSEFRMKMTNDQNDVNLSTLKTKFITILKCNLFHWVQWLSDRREQKAKYN